MSKNLFYLSLVILITYLLVFNFSYLFINKTPFNGCVDCHDEMQGFEASHSPEVIGCNSCHLGNPNTSNKIFAHKNMILIPGNLSNAKETCGVTNCHPGIPDRVNSSLMNTMSGVISVNRFAFDEIKKPEGHFNVKELTQSNADNHNRNLCASCHLGNEKTNWGAINELSRGGGCNACHLNYDIEAIDQLNKYLDSKKNQKSIQTNYLNENFPKIHPRLNLNVTNDHCFGCHSRSGRISTNYEGWFETLLTTEEFGSINNIQTNKSRNNNKSFRLLMDGRVFQKGQDDIHHKAGMDCVDCHLSLEIMGDGNSYQHMEEQSIIQCVDCHSSVHRSISYEQLDYESKKIADLRNFNNDNSKFLTTTKSNVPLFNTKVNFSEEKYLLTKSTKKKLFLKPPLKICVSSNAHRRLSCNSCHTEWVSHCTGCHTEYDSNLDGFDLLDNKDITGSWRETPSDFYVDYPVLGVRKEKNGQEIIDTFIPGMVLTIDKMKNDPKGKISKRLFAPTFSHTINKQGRSCKSCHNNPLALGYGKGKLTYSSDGRWFFEPQFSNHKEDNLPKDSWIGFLNSRDETSTTRTYTRPFTVIEQKRILRVGACLTCHNEKSTIISESLINFQKALKQVSDKCILPKSWNF